MPYTSQDKYDFAIKDIKYAIGQGVGNAFSKAVDCIIARGIDGQTKEQILEQILPLRDMMFNENQGKIKYEIEKWISENDRQLKLDTGLEVPMIENGIEI